MRTKKVVDKYAMKVVRERIGMNSKILLFLLILLGVLPMSVWAEDFYVESSDGSVRFVQNGDPNDSNIVEWQIRLYRQGDSPNLNSHCWGMITGKTMAAVQNELKKSQEFQRFYEKWIGHDEKDTYFNTLGPLAIEGNAPNVGKSVPDQVRERLSKLLDAFIAAKAFVHSFMTAETHDEFEQQLQNLPAAQREQAVAFDVLAGHLWDAEDGVMMNQGDMNAEADVIGEDLDTVQDDLGKAESYLGAIKVPANPNSSDAFDFSIQHITVPNPGKNNQDQVSTSQASIENGYLICKVTEHWVTSGYSNLSNYTEKAALSDLDPDAIGVSNRPGDGGYFGFTVSIAGKAVFTTQRNIAGGVEIRNTPDSPSENIILHFETQEQAQEAAQKLKELILGARSDNSGN